MQTIRGAVTLNSFINNAPGTIAEFFELSPFALTYSRERGEYQDAGFSGYVFHAFKAVDSTTNATYVLPSTQVTEILGVVKAVLTYMSGKSYPYDLADLRNTVQAAFSASITSFATGSLHTGTDITLPDYLTWTSTAHNNAEIKIWLRNEAFENQYSDFEIITSPPIDQLDRFFGTYGDLATELAAISVSDTIDRVQTYENGIPATVIRLYSFNFLNKNATTQSTPVVWGTLVYGRNGDNVDSIKDALVAYILANSTHSQAEWEVIFPDLFKRTEFLFCPRWDKVAIANLTAASALYSSAADPLESIEYAKAFWPEVAGSFVEANLTLLPFDYKAITLMALNGQSNLAGKTSLMSLFPDYIPVSTSSPDFNRMVIYTREWLLMMVELINFAETADEFTTIVSPMRRIIRNGKIYVSRIYDSVNYMVACRSNLN